MHKKVEEEGLLLETILKLFNEQSHKKLKSYLKNNSVFVNGKSITAYNYKVKKNDTIEIRKDYKTVFSFSLVVAIVNKCAGFSITKKYSSS